MDLIKMSALFGLIGALIVLFIYVATRPKTVDTEKEFGSARDENRVIRYSNTTFGAFYQKFMSRFVKRGAVENFGHFVGVNIDKLDDEIKAAGLEDKYTAIEIVAMKMLAPVAVGAGVIAYISTESLYVLGGAILVAVALFFVPEGDLDDAVKAKKNEILEQLPHYIEETFLCVEAGATLKDSLQYVAENTGGSLGKAIRDAFTASSYGTRWSDELVKMAYSMNIDPLTDFVNDVVIAEEKGTDPSGVLRREVGMIDKLNRARVIGNLKALDAKLTPLQLLIGMLPLMAIIMMPMLIELLDML